MAPTVIEVRNLTRVYQGSGHLTGGPGSRGCSSRSICRIRRRRQWRGIRRAALHCEVNSSERVHVDIDNVVRGPRRGAARRTRARAHPKRAHRFCLPELQPPRADERDRERRSATVLRRRGTDPPASSAGPERGRGSARWVSSIGSGTHRVNSPLSGRADAARLAGC
jgi:hypothetical protein